MVNKSALFLHIFSALLAEAEERIRPHREAYEAALADARSGNMDAMDRLPGLAATLLQESMK